MFSVAWKKDVIAKDKGRYRSFPYMVPTDAGGLLVAYRDSGSAPGVYAHGASNGDICLLRSTATGWSSPAMLYRHEPTQGEEFDGILSRLKDGTILIWSRLLGNEPRYLGYGPVFIARSQDNGRTFAPRTEVSFPDIAVWVCFGKIRELDDGTLITAGYGVRKGETETDRNRRWRPFFMRSFDKGNSWQFVSWMGENGCNETSLLRLPDGGIYALMRTDGVFHGTRSTDNGLTWSRPKKEFAGQAPNVQALSTGELFVGYRGGPAGSGRSYCCRVSGDRGETWGPELVIDDRKNKAPGSAGYGDALEQADGSIRLIYYTSDDDEAPWLEEALIVRKQ